MACARVGYQNDALEFEQLKTRIQYRNRYADTPKHLVQDCARLGALLTPYEAHVEEAIAWYEEALPELDRIARLTEGVELLNGYFKALQKLPGWPERILAWLPKLIDLALASEARGMYHHVANWMMFLAPSLQDSDEFGRRYSETLARFRALDRSGMGECERCQEVGRSLLRNRPPREQSSRRRRHSRLLRLARRVVVLQALAETEALPL